MKKTLIFFGALTLMLTLTNCSSSNAEDKTPATGDNVSAEPSGGKLSLMVKPKSSYVLSGQEYSAEVYLVQELPANTSVELTSESGGKGTLTQDKDKISYSVLPSGEGDQSFSGNLIFDKGNGKKDTMSFTSEYTMGRSGAAIITKYLVKGIENPLNVSASGIPPNKLKVEASEGKLTGGTGGRYMLTPGKTGPCTVTVKSELNGQMETISTYTYEVIEKK